MEKIEKGRTSKQIIENVDTDTIFTSIHSGYASDNFVVSLVEKHKEREVNQMNDLQIFRSKEFGQVRTVVLDGEPWFVGKDVAEALGYEKSRNAIAAHVDREDKKVAPIQGSLGGKQEMIIINESGLYSLIFSSRLPSARKFKHWVTSEILPTLRKTGAYIVGTSFQYPVSAAALQGATNAGRLFERIMRSEGVPPHEIAMVVRSIFLQAGIDILDCAVRIPAYEQLTLDVVMR